MFTSELLIRFLESLVIGLVVVACICSLALMPLESVLKQLGYLIVVLAWLLQLAQRARLRSKV